MSKHNTSFSLLSNNLNLNKQSESDKDRLKRHEEHILILESALNGLIDTIEEYKNNKNISKEDLFVDCEFVKNFIKDSKNIHRKGK